MTRYDPSMIVADAAHQDLASGFPVGKRFASVEVVRVCDGNVIHLGHHARADGRWRVYAFADAAAGSERSALDAWAKWMSSPESPISRHTPVGADADAVFDIKAIYRQRFEDVDISRVPELFAPLTGPLGLRDWEKVYAAGPSAWTRADIFAERGISHEGAVVIVRPDQYVAAVLPLDDPQALAAFFDGVLLSPSGR